MRIDSLPLAITCFAAFIGNVALIKVTPDLTDPSHHSIQLLQKTNQESESRQNIPQYSNNFIYHPNYRPPKYQYPSNPSKYRPQYPSYPQNYGYRPQFHVYRPQIQQQYEPSNGQFGGSQQGFMDIIESVAANDELQCVSKILCEMTSGRRQVGSSQQSFVNLESLLTLLSSVDDTTASPFVKFGKAFILGYTSKHISQCRYAYPRCPSDPDKLIHYLNNQNGGIFKFFNGFQTPTNRRIQNNISNVFFNNLYNIYSNNYNQKSNSWIFPSYKNENYNDNQGGVSYKKGKSLKFPGDTYEQGDSEIKLQNTRGLSSFYFPDSFFLRGTDINDNSIIFKDNK